MGWRIDYQLATSALAERAAAQVYKAQRFGDLLPLTVGVRARSLALGRWQMGRCSRYTWLGMIPVRRRKH